MKKILIALIASISSLTAWADTNSTLQAHFDERVDLMALIARLAGAKEYTNCIDTAYAAQADKYFEAQKDSKAVAIYQSIRAKNGCSYDAVAAFALNMKFTDDPKQPLTFDSNIKPGSDTSFSRWPKKQRKAMLKAVNEFYVASDFHQWYLSTQDIRTAQEAKQQRTYDRLDINWYDRFFKPADNMKRDIIVSLLVGQNNYGLSYELKDGSSVTSPVYGIWKWNDLVVVVHEFCHPYCNPLIDQHWSEIKQAAECAYEPNKDLLKKQAYTTPKIMMYETFVRASVVNYVMEYFPQIDAKALLDNEREMGFTLVDTLTESLQRYRQHRDDYPTMDAYMPTLIQNINATKVE